MGREIPVEKFEQVIQGVADPLGSFKLASTISDRRKEVGKHRQEAR